MSVDLKIIVKAIDQASDTLNDIGKEVSKAEGGFGRLGSVLKGGLVVGAGAAVAGIGALAAVLGASVKAASEAEQIGAQLNAVLESTGGIAGVTRDELEKQALALSQITRFEDDAILAGNAVLLTFTNIGKEVFPRATEATLDLATAFGMDLQSATMMIGKALNDPVAGLTALSRAGVQFTADQKEMIAAMVEAGNTAGAQALILKELETQIGGSAQAAGETMAGQMDIMKNALGNVAEQIGGALLPVVTDLITKLGPGFIAAAQGFATWFTGKALPAMQQFGQFLELKVLPVLQQFGSFIATSVVPVVKDLWQWLGPALGGVLENLGRLFEGVALAVQGTLSAFQAVIGWARDALAAIKDAIAALREFSGMDGAFAGAGAGYGSTPTAPAGGGGYGSTPSAPAGGGGYGSTPPGRSASGMIVNLTVNAPGGNPMAVAQAAQTGVLAAARSMGIA